MRFPHVVDLNVTGRCNLQCSYCYGPTPDLEELELCDIERALDILASGGTSGIVLTGGEPLIRDDIVDVLRAMVRRDMKIALQTNATLLRKKPEVLEYIDWLCMPLDGSSEEMVATVRGHDGSFHAVVDALEWVGALSSRRFRTKIGTVVTQQNKLDLPDIASILSAHHVDVWKCHEIRPRGKAKENFQRLYVPGEEVARLLGIARTRFPELNIYFSQRRKSLGAYLFLFPDGELLTPMMDSYRSLGSIFNIPDDFDYTEVLNLDNYQSNVRAAFLDTFIKGGEERVAVDVLVQSGIVRRSMEITYALLGAENLVAPSIDLRFVPLEETDSGTAPEPDLVVLVPTGPRISVCDEIKQVLSAYPGVETWICESPEDIVRQDNAAGRLLLGLHQVKTIGPFRSWIDLVARIADGTPRGAPTVKSIYPAVPAALLRRGNRHIIEYLILTERLDRSQFRMMSEDWRALEASIRKTLPAVDTDAYYRNILGNKLLHDVRVTSRSLVNYLACFRAFGDLDDPGEEKVRAVSDHLALDLSIDAFLDQVESLSLNDAAGGPHQGISLSSLMAGLRVLLIDDLPEPWAVLLSVALGAEVQTVTSVQRAIELVKELPTFDLVFLDLYLSDDGEPDGLEVLRVYDELGECPPVIVLSSSDSTETHRQIRRSARDVEFIGKTFESLSDIQPYLDMKAFLSRVVRTRTVGAFLSRPEMRERIQRIADRFHTYGIDGNSVSEYLAQFRSPRNVRMALKVLEGIRFFRRPDISSTFYDLLEQHITDPSRAIIVDPGGAFDSYKLISYVQGDFLQTRRYRSLEAAGSLPDALSLVEKSDGRRDTLIFLDDLLGLGNQLRQIYGEWLGVPVANRVDEQHVRPLESEHARSLFKNLRIVHFFIVAFLEGIQTMEKFWQEHGFVSASVVPGLVTRECESCFDSASLVFDDYREAREAEGLFRRIGEELMETRSDLAPETRKARALGYGNSGKQFVFFYNTPTCTVTALWKDGTFAGTPWVPLFKRRRKE